MQVGEEFDLLIEGYWIAVTLRCEGSSHFYCTTEEEGYQGFRIEFPPKEGDTIFLFARKKEPHLPRQGSGMGAGSKGVSKE